MQSIKDNIRYIKVPVSQEARFSEFHWPVSRCKVRKIFPYVFSLHNQIIFICIDIFVSRSDRSRSYYRYPFCDDSATNHFLEIENQKIQHNCDFSCARMCNLNLTFLSLDIQKMSSNVWKVTLHFK